MEKKENMKVYGVLIQFKDGMILRDNFNSNVLGNILAIVRGNLDSKQTIHEFPYQNNNTIKITNEEYKNNNEDIVFIPFNNISYIKYKLNKGIIGPEKQEHVYDWEKYLKE